MEQIIIQVKDKKKAQLLRDLLSSLDFVDSVKTTEITAIDGGQAIEENPVDFFSVAGLWSDREIDLTSICQKAWPRQQS
jgi:hypothetical protein